MLTEVIEALCHHPDKLTVDFYEDEATIRVCILAHPTDAKIIVGTGAAHLKAIAGLARLLFRSAHKLVQVMPVSSTDDAEEPYRQFKAKDDWQEAKLIDLMTRLTQTIFDGSTVQVKSIGESTWSNIFSVTVSPAQDGRDFRRFAISIAALFVPIGSNHGRMIFANAKNK